MKTRRSVGQQIAGAVGEAQLGLVSTPLLNDPDVHITTTGCE